MDDPEILARIRTMVEDEHELRRKIQEHATPPEAAKQQLRQLEEALDQCWDLLRQRRAREDVHQDPDQASVRPVGQVEGYLG